MKQDRNQLGEMVRRLRIQRGLSLRALGRRVGVDYSWIMRLERGDYERPDPRLLNALAERFEVDVADLFVAAGYETAPSLPQLGIYLRTKFELPEEAVAEMQQLFDRVNERYRPERKEAS